MKQKYYVNGESSAANPDGRSWESAYADLQSAVDAAFAAGGGEVWVAAGTYTATTDPVLTMKEGVALYGGFAGTESELEARDWESRVTVIDGENIRRCVNGVRDARLDGFTITNGRSDRGGGMFIGAGANPVVTNCIFTENFAEEEGGGIFNLGEPTVENCNFAGNIAEIGGGMFNRGTTLTVVASHFTANFARVAGGGMYNEAASPVVKNCGIVANVAVNGGGMYNKYSSPVITNCTLAANIASGDGAGMYNDYSSPVIELVSVVRNIASEWGGGFYNYESSLATGHIGFVGNRATEEDNVKNVCSTVVSIVPPPPRPR
jgi:hypothetical protein